MTRVFFCVAAGDSYAMMPPPPGKREGLGGRHNALQRRGSHELVPLPPTTGGDSSQPCPPGRGQERNYDDGWADKKYGERANEEAHTPPRGSTPAPTRSRSVPSSRYLEEGEDSSTGSGRERSVQYQEMERIRAEEAVRERLERQAKIMKVWC